MKWKIKTKPAAPKPKQYNVHKSLKTLPFGCYANIHNSLIDGQPEYRWLMVFDYMFGELPMEYPDNLSEIYESMLIEQPDFLNKDAIEKQILAEVYAYDVTHFTKIYPDKQRAAEAKNRLFRIEHELEMSRKPATKLDADTLCVAIQLTLNVPQINVYDISTTRFFKLLDLTEKQQNRNGNR